MVFPELESWAGIGGGILLPHNFAWLTDLIEVLGMDQTHIEDLKQK